MHGLVEWWDECNGWLGGISLADTALSSSPLALTTLRLTHHWYSRKYRNNANKDDLAAVWKCRFTTSVVVIFTCCLFFSACLNGLILNKQSLATFHAMATLTPFGVFYVLHRFAYTHTHKQTNTRTRTHTLTLTLTHSHSHSHTHSQTQTRLDVSVRSFTSIVSNLMLFGVLLNMMLISIVNEGKTFSTNSFAIGMVVGAQLLLGCAWGCIWLLIALVFEIYTHLGSNLHYAYVQLILHPLLPTLHLNRFLINECLALLATAAITMFHVYLSDRVLQANVATSNTKTLQIKIVKKDNHPKKDKHRLSTKTIDVLRACESGDLAALSRLLAKCRSSDERRRFVQTEQRGLTPLLLAVDNNHANIVRQLLLTKAPASQSLADGTTPLACACRNGNTEIVSMLLIAGADCNERTSNGMTPLAIACQKGHTEVSHPFLPPFPLALLCLCFPGGLKRNKCNARVRFFFTLNCFICWFWIQLDLFSSHLITISCQTPVRS